MNSTLLTGSEESLEDLRNKYFYKYENDPIAWAYDFLDLPDRLWEKQEEIISSAFTYNYTAVKSGHGIGKSFSSAILVLAFLYTKIPSKVITTAPTFKQVYEILWREIRKLYYGARINLEGELLKIKLSIDEDWFALGLHPREYDLNAFQGYHSENILVILDESPGVSEDLYKAAISLMTTRNAHLLEIGNPSMPAGHFYNAFQPNSDYHKIHISCFDSPNLKENKIVRPYLVTSEWVDGIRKRWGEDSSFYQSKVLGDFPSSEEVSFVPLEWVEASMKED